MHTFMTVVVDLFSFSSSTPSFGGGCFRVVFAYLLYLPVITHWPAHVFEMNSNAYLYIPCPVHACERLDVSLNESRERQGVFVK